VQVESIKTYEACSKILDDCTVFLVLTRLTCQSIVRLCCRGCLYSHDQLRVQSKDIGC
jgi:hypothetical protein